MAKMQWLIVAGAALVLLLGWVAMRSTGPQETTPPLIPPASQTPK